MQAKSKNYYQIKANLKIQIELCFKENTSF